MPPKPKAVKSAQIYAASSHSHYKGKQFQQMQQSSESDSDEDRSDDDDSEDEDESGDNESDEDDEEEESDEVDELFADLTLDDLDDLAEGEDITAYVQMQFAHCTNVTRFRSQAQCWFCFQEKYNLSRDVITNLYTQDLLFKKLNKALCTQKNSSQSRMFSLMLSVVLFEVVEKLPTIVYRGVRYSKKLFDMYKKNVGELVYLYQFVSTSRDRSVAQGFATETGYIMEITLIPQNRHSVADISGRSKYPHESEILIACNAGFRIDRVEGRTIFLTLEDESHCITKVPNRRCRQHANGHFY